MTTASEIQQLALEVFENKLNYKNNDFIVIMNILKENYMKVKGILNEFGNEKATEYPGTRVVDSDSDSDKYLLYAASKRTRLPTGHNARSLLMSSS